MHPRKLEEFKAFPFVAWFLVISFSAFTITLSERLSDETGVSGDVRNHKTMVQNFLNK